MNVETRPFSLELSNPLETAAGTIETREGFLVRVEEDGEYGVGEATPLPGWTESAEECERALDRAVGAASGDEPGRRALAACEKVPGARHGLSLALLDLRSKREGVPLYRYLDGPDAVDHVPVNATVGDGTSHEAAESALAARREGFGTVKLKVGGRPLPEDEERVRRVRDAVGSTVELRVDANGAWDRAEARNALDFLADYDVSLLEQPLPADDFEGHRALRGEGVDVAVDEGLAERGIDAVLAADAADAVVLKPMALGGPDVARKVGAWALECGIVPIVTTTVDGVVARTAAIHVAASLPEVPACGLATGRFLAEDLGPDPAPIVAGRIVVPGKDGNGVAGVWEA